MLAQSNLLRLLKAVSDTYLHIHTWRILWLSIDAHCCFPLVPSWPSLPSLPCFWLRWSLTRPPACSHHPPHSSAPIGLRQAPLGTAVLMDPEAMVIHTIQCLISITTSLTICDIDMDNMFEEISLRKPSSFLQKFMLHEVQVYINRHHEQVSASPFFLSFFRFLFFFSFLKVVLVDMGMLSGNPHSIQWFLPAVLPSSSRAKAVELVIRYGQNFLSSLNWGMIIIDLFELVDDFTLSFTRWNARRMWLAQATRLPL